MRAAVGGVLAALAASVASSVAAAGPSPAIVAAPPSATAPAITPDTPPLASLERSCQLIDKRLKSVSAKDCLDAGLRSSLTASTQGQPILWRDYRSAAPRGNGRRILLIGGIHGDEFSAVSIVFQWMRRLASDRFQPFYWRVVPCLNPDGLLSIPETRTNANGVDLNRNFPTPDWEETAVAYWKSRTRSDPRRYPGPAAQSEPETRWLIRHIERFRPHAIVTVHAPYGVLDYDGPREPPLRLGFLRLNLLGAYPGSLGRYAGLYLGVPVVTLELPRAGILPTTAQAARIWTDLLGWLERELPDGPPPRAASAQLREPWRAVLPEASLTAD